jgi:hypothetical protein
MDYSQTFGFSDDETKCWLGLKRPPRAPVFLDALYVVVTNCTIAFLLVYGASSKNEVLVWLGLVWVLSLTGLTVAARLEQRRHRVHFQSLAEKVEARIRPEGEVVTGHA